MKTKELEKITISENVKNKFFNGLKIGLDLEEALIYSKIDKYDFIKIYNNYKLVNNYIYINNLYNNSNNISNLINNSNNNLVNNNSNIIENNKELKLSLISNNFNIDTFISKNILFIRQLENDANFKDYAFSCYEFIQETKRCKIELQYKLLNDLQESENRNTTTGASFLLERLFKAKFGKEAEIEQEEKTLPPIQITFSNVQDQQQRLQDIENIVSLELNADTKKA